MASKRCPRMAILEGWPITSSFEFWELIALLFVVYEEIGTIVRGADRVQLRADWDIESLFGLLTGNEPHVQPVGIRNTVSLLKFTQRIV